MTKGQRRIQYGQWKLNGYQRKIVSYALKVELQAKRDGLYWKDDFYRGYSHAIEHLSKIHTIAYKTREWAANREQDMRYSRDFRLGMKAGVYDLSSLFSDDWTVSRNHARMLDWVEANKREKIRKAKFAKELAKLERELEL